MPLLPVCLLFIEETALSDARGPRHASDLQPLSSTVSAHAPQSTSQACTWGPPRAHRAGDAQRQVVGLRAGAHGVHHLPSAWSLGCTVAHGPPPTSTRAGRCTAHSHCKGMRARPQLPRARRGASTMHTAGRSARAARAAHASTARAQNSSQGRQGWAEYTADNARLQRLGHAGDERLGVRDQVAVQVAHVRVQNSHLVSHRSGHLRARCARQPGRARRRRAARRGCSGRPRGRAPPRAARGNGRPWLHPAAAGGPQGTRRRGSPPGLQSRIEGCAVGADRAVWRARVQAQRL
jgi:hypothetical protein